MIPTPHRALPALAPLPSVPGWARPRGPVTSDVEAAFLAGAALNSLDNLVRNVRPWAGAWRQRLALRCAATAVSMAGRTEDEAALRDAWYLRPTNGDPGPAGRIFEAWKQLADRSPGIDAASLKSTVGWLGLHGGDELEPLIERVAALGRSSEPAPIAAAAIVIEVMAIRPDAELLGWWLADQVMALKLRWPLPVPLLVSQARSSAFREEGGRSRRIRPGEEGFERGVCVALAQAAAEACRLAAEIAPRAARLEATVPKLRAKGAGEAIQRLLDDDAVPGTLHTAQLTRWGSRRLFERLLALDAVRELSGRSAFKLYGL